MPKRIHDLNKDFTYGGGAWVDLTQMLNAPLTYID